MMQLTMKLWARVHAQLNANQEPGCVFGKKLGPGQKFGLEHYTQEMQLCKPTGFASKSNRARHIGTYLVALEWSPSEPTRRFFRRLFTA